MKNTIVRTGTRCEGATGASSSSYSAAGRRLLRREWEDDLAALQSSVGKRAMLECLLESVRVRTCEDWVGDGRSQVLVETVRTSLGLLRELPVGLPVAEVSVTERGEVLFCWNADDDRKLSARVAARGKILFRSEFGDSEVVYGKLSRTSFLEEIPRRLRRVFDTHL